MLLVSGPHWVPPPPPTHGMCAFPVYTAQAPGCSTGELSKACSGLHALPRSKPLKFRFLGTPQRCRLGLACVLCPSQVPAAQAMRCLVSTLSPCGALHLITSPIPATQPPGCTVGLLPQVYCVSPLGSYLWLRPSWWMSTIQDLEKTWLATGSCSQIDRGCHLWGRDCPFLALAVACLPLCLQGLGEGQDHRWLVLLWYSLSPLFCEQAWQCLRLELRLEKVLSFSLSFFLPLAIPQFGLLSHVSSLRLSSGPSGLILTLSNAAHASLFSPCLLVANTSV